MKVTIVGAGNVGATAADVIASKSIASNIILLDIKEGFAEGKALDLMQTSSTKGFDSQITGTTGDYSLTKDSDVVVITSGIPRKPGMTREELIGINANIVKDVTSNILKYSSNPIIVMVSNPMDTMTYLALKSTGLDPKKVIGMGGALDSSRFKTYISLSLNKLQKDIDAMVIGGHGDTTMIPLYRFAKYKNEPLSNILSSKEIEKIVKSTMVGGATLTKHLGTSAWYAPGSSIAYLVDCILNNKRKTITCSVLLNGEYNQNDLCIGVPCIIGKIGIEEIIELDLNNDEMTKFNQSAAAVRSMNSTLSDHT
tara:strand:+ start:3359 stop:4291 length:933 start_codon:yes stop_codon:yes gene_type:complete